MECTRCLLRRVVHGSRRTIDHISRRDFSSSPATQRLGAATYTQEWQNGTYHYNKQTTKNLPTAAMTVDKLLQAYATMKVPGTSTRNARDKDAVQRAMRTAIAAQRRTDERVFISHSLAKEFGDKVVIDAYIYDGKKGAEEELERRKASQAAERAGRAGAMKGGKGRGGRRGAVGSGPGSGSQ